MAVSGKASDGNGSAAKRAEVRKKPTNAAYDAEELLHYYTEMLTIRRLEEKAGQMYGMGLIGGFCHLYIGQEAVVVGMQAAIAPQDSVITSYRDHGHMIACGMDPKGVLAELCGRRAGYSKGKGGSMHMFSREKNFFGGHGIVGGHVPLATGVGFAIKYRGGDHITDFASGDTLNVHDLMAANAGKAVADVIHVTDGTDGTVLSYNVKGTFYDFVTLDGVHGVTLSSLQASGMIVV